MVVGVNPLDEAPMHAIGGIGEGLVELSFAPTAADPDAMRIGYGGDVANVLAMAAQLGAAARLLAGRVGDDGFKARLLALLGREHGVDCRKGASQHAGAATGVYLRTRRPEGGEHRPPSYWRRAARPAAAWTAADLPDRFFDGLATLVVSGITLAISSTAPPPRRYAAERVAPPAAASPSCSTTARRSTPTPTRSPPSRPPATS